MPDRFYLGIVVIVLKHLGASISLSRGGSCFFVAVRLRHSSMFSCVEKLQLSPAAMETTSHRLRWVGMVEPGKQHSESEGELLVEGEI